MAKHYKRYSIDEITRKEIRSALNMVTKSFDYTTTLRIALDRPEIDEITLNQIRRRLDTLPGYPFGLSITLNNLKEVEHDSYTRSKRNPWCGIGDYIRRIFCRKRTD